MSYIGEGCFLTLLTIHLIYMKKQDVIYMKKQDVQYWTSCFFIIKLLITACRCSGDVAHAHGVDDAHAPRNPRVSQGEPCERA